MNNQEINQNTRSRKAIWLNKAEIQKVKEIIAKIEPSIQEVNKTDWEELKKITTVPKQMNASKTYMITATIIEKSRERYKGGQDQEGNNIKGKNYWKLELDNRNTIFVFHSTLDNVLARKIGSKEYDEIANSLATGKKYEFEVEKSSYGNYWLRNARAL